jgi:U3 small nucleolar RNA-associated protein 3
MPPRELRQHPIMQSLLRARQSWDSVKDLEVADAQSTAEELDADPEEMPAKSHSTKTSMDAPEALAVLDKPMREKKSKKSKKLMSDNKEPSKRMKQAHKGNESGGVLDELDNLIASVKSTSKMRAEIADEEESDFGDEVALTAQEAAEKAQRKKGLRFYTSQLAQKSNKRGAASRDAGGDADLPYKERLKDRQARLMREAEKRGGEKAQLEQMLDYQDEDEDEETARVAKEIRGDASDSENYYQTIVSKSKAKKADKAARAAAHAEAAKVGGEVYVEDTVGADGKRGITYEISKNKGLMPRRKKEVRNPRVKKRMKYDEKMKKLGSIRQVYKGGEGKGGYGGELSGIKTNIVRSVKL